MRRLIVSGSVMCALLVPRPAAAQIPVIIGLEDRVSVTVDGQPELSGRYAVERDGAVVFPLIGRVEAAGLTSLALADVLTRRLEAYFRDPRVHVVVQRPERVFVFGAVGKPGMYDVTGVGMTILELLVQAQYKGVSEVLVVRTKGARGPMLPDQAASSDVITVNMRDVEKALEGGDLSRNLRLEPGDTVFVPEVDPNAVHVSGEVLNPGAYSVPDGTTVRQVLALAGGITDQASLRRLRILRIESGEQRQHRLHLDDPTERGDTVVVPEAIAIAAVPIPPGIGIAEPPERDRGQIRIGSALTVTPSLAVTEFGIHTNVFNTRSNRKAAFVAEVSPTLQAVLDVARFRLEGSSAIGLAYYRGVPTEHAVSPRHNVSATIALARGVAVSAAYGVGKVKERFSVELDTRVRRDEEQLGGSIELGPWRRLRFDISGGELKRRFPEEVSTLTERTQDVSARAVLALSPLSSVFASAGATTRRFPLHLVRNADSREFVFGATFKRRAFVEGAAYLQFTQYMPFDVTVPDANVGGVGGILSRTWRERAQLGVRVERSVGATFKTEFPYAVVTGYGGWIQTILSGWLDVIAETFHDRYDYRTFSVAAARDRVLEQTVRYTAQVGVRVKSARVALEVSRVQRVGGSDVNASSRDYSGWRTNVSYDMGYRFFQVRRDEGSSIRGRDGFRNY